MSQADITFVHAMYAAFSHGDVETVVQGCTPDIDWKPGGGEADFPGFGPRNGAAGVRDFFRSVAEQLEFNEFLPQEFYADRDAVFVLVHYAEKMRTTGNRFDSEWCHVFTFRGGTVENFREFTDTANIRAGISRRLN